MEKKCGFSLLRELGGPFPTLVRKLEGVPGQSVIHTGACLDCLLRQGQGIVEEETENSPLVWWYFEFLSFFFICRVLISFMSSSRCCTCFVATFAGRGGGDCVYSILLGSVPHVCVLLLFVFF